MDKLDFNEFSKKIKNDIGFGLWDIIDIIIKNEYSRMFERPEHHLAIGILLLSITLLIPIIKLG